jgi:hypothetical protein
VSVPSAVGSGRIRLALLRLLLAGVSTIAALFAAYALAEAYFRAFQPASYVPDPTIIADASLGWDTQPPVKPLPLNRGNGPGVAFLGDSFTDRYHWPDEAQRLLAARGVSVDGFNLGVTGYGTTQALLKLQQHAGALAPRAIVLLLFAWNDLRDNYPYPELYYGPQRVSRPFLVVQDGHTTLLPVEWRSSLAAGLLRSEVYLRFVNRLELKIGKTMMERGPEWPTQRRSRVKVYYEEPASWHPFYTPAMADNPYVRGAYDSTRAALQRIRDLAAGRGAALLVIGIDSAFTVDRDQHDAYLAPYPELDPSLPLTRLAALMREERIDFIDAQPALAALAAASGAAIYNGPPGAGIAGHLHPAGDRLIGDLAAGWLAEHLPR